MISRRTSAQTSDPVNKNANLFFLSSIEEKDRDMKKINHRLFPLLFWLLLLVCGGTSAHAQPARGEATYPQQPGEGRQRPRPPATELFDPSVMREATTQPPNSVHVEIYYSKEYGYSGSGSPFGGETGPTSCGSFSVNFQMDPRARQETLIPLTREPIMRELDGYYMCDFLISALPLNHEITVSAKLGEGVSPTAAWRGGSQPQPPSGWRREVSNGTKTVMLTESEPRVSLSFEMVYTPMPDFVRPRPSRNRLFEAP